MAGQGRQIYHHCCSFGQDGRCRRAPPKAHPHHHGWTLVRLASPPSAEIRLGLTRFGVIFSFRILMLLDKGFLAMVNILFVSGVSLTIGLSQLSSSSQSLRIARPYTCNIELVSRL
ncbi:uncharacterized protein LOC119296017 [Triticum dicoccoides]|uniref:uncharacterized protein LOC119296017 n=1 Tax=Triticum dicoccoides TaxID=85692 RepID=UPI000844608B|nr:uncharacterized protein LOC119296017 [Triticum dicoccoides]XP_044369518.1 uncharacterized protein LOC123091954 [Triticum aestivum]